MKLTKFKQLKIILFSFFIITTANAEINVAVSANMKPTTNILIKEFNKKYKNIKINTSSASSGELFQQIYNGAPFQLFISADTSFPNKIFKSNLAINKPYIYAYGQIIIAVNNKNIKINRLKDITNKNISSIAMANPNLAPYGKVSIQLLKQNNLYNKIKSKIVYANSLNEVNQLVFSKSVDIAFTSKSALLLNNTMKYYNIPKKLYKEIPQAIVLIKNKNMSNYKEALLFYNFIKSNNAKKILINSGYIVK